MKWVAGLIQSACGGQSVAKTIPRRAERNQEERLYLGQADASAGNTRGAFLALYHQNRAACRTGLTPLPRHKASLSGLEKSLLVVELVGNPVFNPRNL